MKTLILLSRIDQTGVTTNTLDLVSGLINENNEVYLITGSPVEDNNPRHDTIYANFKKIGTHVIPFNIPKGNA